MKLSANQLRLLLQEVAKWQQQGVISPESAARISVSYQEALSSIRLQQKKAQKTFLWSLGGIFLVFALILILSYNWNELSPQLQLLLGFAPLIPGAAGGYLVLGKNGTAGSREVVCMWLMGAAATALAVTGQVYQLPGGMYEFLQVILPLTVGLIYFFQSVGGALLYFVGLFLFAAEGEFANSSERTVAFFWYLGFLSLLIPFLIAYLHRNKNGFIPQLLRLATMWGVFCLTWWMPGDQFYLAVVAQSIFFLLLGVTLLPVSGNNLYFWGGFVQAMVMVLVCMTHGDWIVWDGFSSFLILPGVFLLASCYLVFETGKKDFLLLILLYFLVWGLPEVYNQTTDFAGWGIYFCIFGGTAAYFCNSGIRQENGRRFLCGGIFIITVLLGAIFSSLFSTLFRGVLLALMALVVWGMAFLWRKMQKSGGEQ